MPFILDDYGAITLNLSIEHIDRLATVLSPRSGELIAGRPILNLAYAINYAISNIEVWSYHAVNLAIHLAAAFALFGLVRRTLTLPKFRGQYASDAFPIALLITVLWTLHPLQTNCVTYISQRAEALMGLFYLLTLYCFARSATSPMPLRWRALSVLACFAGMATKEVMVTAPLMVLLYDRVFVSESVGTAIGRRPGYYCAMGLAWFFLGSLMVISRLSARGVGFDTEISWYVYAMTELKVLVLYARLSFWPSPLVFDYGAEYLVKDPLAAAPYAVLIAGAVAGIAVLLYRRRFEAAFLAAAFFILLAPTSSFVPVAGQPMAESRMYLPLAAIITLVVMTVWQRLGARAFLGFVMIALLFAVGTLRRNFDYNDAITLWRDTLAKNPRNSRAHNNLAIQLGELPGKRAEAIAHYEESLRINPEVAATHNNLGSELARIPGRMAEAIAHYGEAVRLKANYAEAHYNFAIELGKTSGRRAQVLSEYEEALRLKPGFAEAHNNLAMELRNIPERRSEAVAHFEQALKINPAYAEAHNNLGMELSRTHDRRTEALAHYQAAIHIRPHYAEAHNNLANDLCELPGRLPEAFSHYEAAIRSNPKYANAHLNFGIELAKIPERVPDAIAHFKAAARIKPDLQLAHTQLAILYYQSGRITEAIEYLEQVLRSGPDLAQVRDTLEKMRAMPGEPRSQ